MEKQTKKYNCDERQPLTLKEHLDKCLELVTSILDYSTDIENYFFGASLDRSTPKPEPEVITFEDKLLRLKEKLGDIAVSLSTIKSKL